MYRSCCVKVLSNYIKPLPEIQVFLLDDCMYLLVKVII